MYCSVRLNEIFCFLFVCFFNRLGVFLKRVGR